MANNHTKDYHLLLKFGSIDVLQRRQTKINDRSEILFFFLFEQFCAAVQTSMLIWKSNIIYSEGELTFIITHISEIPHVDKYCFSSYLDSLYKDLFCVTEFFLSLVWELYMNMQINWSGSHSLQTKTTTNAMNILKNFCKLIYSKI